MNTNKFTFYLGINKASWLPTMTIPVMASRNILKHRKNVPTAAYQWVLDSGGFTELSKQGMWTINADDWYNKILNIEMRTTND